MATNDDVLRTLIAPAAIGAMGLLAYGETVGLNRASSALAGTAVGLGVAELAGERSEARVGLLAAAVFGLIAHDRWVDGMWPFTPPPHPSSSSSRLTG